MHVNIAQPALGTQVQALEKGLGVQLLVRSTHKVELTWAGEVFYDRCAQMMGELELSAEMARAAGGRTHTGDQVRHDLSGNDGCACDISGADRSEVSRHTPACVEWLDRQ